MRLEKGDNRSSRYPLRFAADMLRGVRALDGSAETGELPEIRSCAAEQLVAKCWLASTIRACVQTAHCARGIAPAELFPGKY